MSSPVIQRTWTRLEQFYSVPTLNPFFLALEKHFLPPPSSIPTLHDFALNDTALGMHKAPWNKPTPVSEPQEEILLTFSGNKGSEWQINKVANGFRFVGDAHQIHFDITRVLTDQSSVSYYNNANSFEFHHIVSANGDVVTNSGTFLTTPFNTTRQKHSGKVLCATSIRTEKQPVMVIEQGNSVWRFFEESAKSPELSPIGMVIQIMKRNDQNLITKAVIATVFGTKESNNIVFEKIDVNAA